MTFWQLDRPDHAIALIDQNRRSYNYSELRRAAENAAAVLRERAADVILLIFDPSVEAVATYLGALRSGRVPLLLTPNIDPTLVDKLVGIYEPGWIAAPAGSFLPESYRLRCSSGAYSLCVRAETSRHPPPHPECGLLLSTSGSTGSPKLVRLSYAAIAHNAESIATYLGLAADDRAITTLPLAYSFGMSIFNSHLAAGGSLALTSHSLTTREFWATAEAVGITSLSGVPSTFEMFRRVGLEKRRLDRMRMLTQAGGRLSDELTRHFARLADHSGWRFFIMYGQTEASPRISYVPPGRVLDKIGSIGIPIPGGSLALDAATSELVYRGPNAMMGYALSRDDLAKPDECFGTLRTGDLGRQDADGFFYLTGRLKRFVKLSGNRVNLDEIEMALAQALGVTVACTGSDDALAVAVPKEPPIENGRIQQILRDRFNIFAGLVQVHAVSPFPFSPNGKIDYKTLEAVMADRRQTAHAAT